MRLICRLHFGLWLFVLVLSLSHHLTPTLVPVPGLMNPDIRIRIDPASAMGWLAVLFLGTLMAALLALLAERVETELTSLRLAQAAYRSSARIAPPAELTYLRQAIRSADLPAIHEFGTWRALAYADGESLSPFELAVLHGDEAVIRTVREAYFKHQLAYRLRDPAQSI